MTQSKRAKKKAKSNPDRIEELFRQAEAKRAGGDHAGAVRALEEAHLLGHDLALVHLRVHLGWMQTALAAWDLRMAAGQVFPILFAVPVSLVQRYLGLALPSRRVDAR